MLNAANAECCLCWNVTMNRQRYKQTYGQTGREKDGQMDRQLRGETDKWCIDIGTGEWKDKERDEWTNKHTVAMQRKAYTWIKR